MKDAGRPPRGATRDSALAPSDTSEERFRGRAAVPDATTQGVAYNRAGSMVLLNLEGAGLSVDGSDPKDAGTSRSRLVCPLQLGWLIAATHHLIQSHFDGNIGQLRSIRERGVT